MHTSGLHTVAVTVEELTIKVRLLKLSLEELLCFSSCSLVFVVVWGLKFFLKDFIFGLHIVIYIFISPLVYIPEIPTLELLCWKKSLCLHHFDSPLNQKGII